MNRLFIYVNMFCLFNFFHKNGNSLSSFPCSLFNLVLCLETHRNNCNLFLSWFQYYPLLNNITLDGYTQFIIYLFMEIWVASSLRLLLLTLLWIFVHKSLHRYIVLFHLVKYRGVGFLDCVVSRWLALWESAKHFPHGWTILHGPQQFVSCKSTLPQQDLALLVFLIIAILLSVHHILLWS